MPKKLANIDIADFHAKVAAGKRPVSISVRLAQPGSPIAATVERVVSFVFSDNSVDRYGDTIDARGWVLDSFNANPVALFGHDSGSVENVIGKARNVRVQGTQLVGEIEFAEASVNPNAETVYQLVKGGYLSTVSVGFAPLEWALAKDGARPGGIDFKKQELLEISVVPIPANPNALVQARAAGIDVDRLKLAAPVETRVATVSKKGLYAVSQLAQLLAQLGYLSDDSAWEAEYEGDGSAVPQMLADALKALGAALVAMTAEEVSELLGGDDADAPAIAASVLEVDAFAPAQRVAIVLSHAAKVWAKRLEPPEAPAAAIFAPDEIAALKALAATTVKAGKTISAATEKSLRSAHDSITKGCEVLRGVFEAPPEMDDEAKALIERRAAAAAMAAAKSSLTGNA